MRDPWMPIGTAPRDGTHVLLSDGERFAAGYLFVRIEPETKHFGLEDGKIGPRFMEIVPNPRAGERLEGWLTIGCSAFTEDTDIADDDGFFDPTHWMPLFAKPEISGRRGKPAT